MALDVAALDVVREVGEERVAAEPFWAGGKWRMVERVKWWENYDDEIPVISRAQPTPEIEPS